MCEWLSSRDFFARHLLRESLSKQLGSNLHRGLLSAYTSDSGSPCDTAVKTNHNKWRDSPLPLNSKVSIIGAGIAGLYIAMLLQDLQIPNLSYEILEADSRIGGRVYTHRFSDQKDDYYDVGAMRFPKLPFMGRVFDLFGRMKVSLKPFEMKGTNCRQVRNDHVSISQEPLVPDPYRVGQRNGGSVPDEVVDQADALLELALGPFKQALHQDMAQGFKQLMEVDDMSMREYLRQGGKDGRCPKYDFATIQWMETNNTSTGTFDQAFSECVMDSFDFEHPQGEVEWARVEGGTSTVIDRMCWVLRDQEKDPIQLGKSVRQIGIDRTQGGEGNMWVKCAGEAQARTGYLTVFNTTPLACLQRMETSTLQLHSTQKEAIRCLRSENSTKVALKFSYPWWMVECGITEGGCSSSDRPLRTCVYPSPVSPEDRQNSAVLLASYTWGQDASRMGALINRASKEAEEELLELILRDLVAMHQPHVSYKMLRSAYRDHHAFCWGNSPFASGAFAFFGPGQFSHLYPSLCLPAADGKFHIAGEASSIHHGWLVGALNSAYMAVYRFLARFQQWEAIRRLEKNWGTVHENETGYMRQRISKLTHPD